MFDLVKVKEWEICYVVLWSKMYFCFVGGVEGNWVLFLDVVFFD